MWESKSERGDGCSQTPSRPERQSVCSAKLSLSLEAGHRLGRFAGWPTAVGELFLTVTASQPASQPATLPACLPALPAAKQPTRAGTPGQGCKTKRLPSWHERRRARLKQEKKKKQRRKAGLCRRRRTLEAHEQQSSHSKSISFSSRVCYFPFPLCSS